MKSIGALIVASSLVHAVLGSGHCGAGSSTAGQVIEGPSFASVNTQSAAECCERVKPNSKSGAAYGQLRENPVVYNPAPQKAPKGARPVVFIVSDDMRPSLPLYGLDAGHTPALERIAAEGVTFRSAYVQFSYCAPSRNSFMSGRRPDATKTYSFENDFREFDVGNDWLSLPQIFKASGYNTFGGGKLFHEGVPYNFDLPYSWSTPGYTDGGPNSPNQCKEKCCGVPKEQQGFWCMHNLTADGKLTDMWSVDSVLSMLPDAVKEYKETGKPFFAGVGIHKPHITWDFPLDFLIPEENVTAPKYKAWPDDIPHLHWHECAEFSVGGLWDSKGYGVPPWSDDLWKTYRRAYYSCISYVDSLIGEVLDKLEELGVKDDVVYSFIGDHGWSLGEADVTCKMTPDERGTRIPFIIADPRMEASKGAHTQALAEAVDLYPTLVELAMGQPPQGKGTENLGGVSLVPVLKDPNRTTVKDVVLTQFPRCWQNTSSLDYDDTRGGPGDENNHTVSWDSMSDCHWVHRDALDYMGYSIRTKGQDLGEWRYTEWAVWNGEQLRPDWSQIVGRELFNHTGDDGLAWVYDDYVRGEYQNFAEHEGMQGIVARLSKRLREEVEKWITPNPLPAPYHHG